MGFFLLNFTAHIMCIYTGGGGVTQCRTLVQKLDSWLLCNARGASRLAIRYYILIRILEGSIQGF